MRSCKFIFMSIFLWNTAFSQEVGPLVFSRWHQEIGFNHYTPYFDDTGKNAPVGCAALAIGQILFAHQYPYSGEGVISYHCTSINSNLSIDLSSNTYDYTIMPLEIVNSGVGEGGVNSNGSYEVSKLLRDIGYALNIQYDESVTGAGAANVNVWTDFRNFINNSDTKSTYISRNVQKILIENFKYSENIQIINLKGDNLNDNLNRIKEEIEDDRPVIVTGFKFNGNTGHVYIIDGFRYSDNKFHVNYGWDWIYQSNGTLEDPNGWYSFDEWHYNNEMTAVIGIEPKNLNRHLNSRKIQTHKNFEKQINFISSTCPKLLVPQNGEIGGSDKIDFIWEDILEASGYLISIKAVQSNLFYYNQQSTYAGISSFQAPDFLPPNETIEVIIEPFDINGNITTCSSQTFTTSAIPCRTAFEYINTRCDDIGAGYYIEAEFTGITNHTYDLFAELNGTVYASKNSVSQGYHVLGPIPKGQDVAIIVEDESQPNDCNDAVFISAPNCTPCSNVSITSINTTCNGSNYDISLTFSGEIGYLYDINAGSFGNSFDNVSSGTYTIAGIPNGQNVTAFVREDGGDSFCAENRFILAPDCPSVNCAVSGFTFDISDNMVTYSWESSIGVENYIIEEKDYNSNEIENTYTIPFGTNSLTVSYTDCPIFQARIGTDCSTEEDFSSYYTVDLRCIAPSCSDGIQNQGETSIDCGGPCQDCGGACPNECPSGCIVPSYINGEVQSKYAFFEWSHSSDIDYYQVCYGTSSSQVNNCVNVSTNNFYYLNLQDLYCPNNIYFKIISNCNNVANESPIQHLNTSSVNCDTPTGHCSPIEEAIGYINCDDRLIGFAPQVDLGFGTFTVTYSGGTLPYTGGQIIINNFPSCAYRNGSFYYMDYVITHVEGQCSQVGYARVVADDCNGLSECSGNKVCDFIYDNITTNAICAPNGGFQVQICNSISSNIRIRGLANVDILQQGAQCVTYPTIYEAGTTANFILEYRNIACNGKPYSVTKSDCDYLGQCEEEWIVTNSMTTAPIFQAEKLITTLDNISLSANQELIFEAEYIDLNDGFDTETGAFFEARVDPCILNNLEEATQRNNTLSISKEDVSCNKMLNIFPNPFKFQTNIELNLNEDSPITLQLFDITGQKIATIFERELVAKGYHNILLTKLSSIPSGIYVCSLATKNCSVTKQIIIQ